jgi:acetylornithine deacetylase
MPSSSRATAILGDLVAFDTTSRLSNVPLLQYVAAILRENGIEPLLILNEDKSKANLWASIGPRTTGGIIFSGHTDTVPVDGQHWSSDPFRMTERDGLLHGRGTCDMKGFLAAVLALVPKLAKADLKRPIHIAFSHDEELGCVGVRSLIDWLRDNPPGAAFCIVGEPTEMRPVIGHKSGRAYKVRLTGREAHSSLAPRAVNAIDFAAELIVFLRSIAEQMRAGATDSLYDVPYSTLSTGMIKGGSAINIVPRECEFVFEYRCLAGMDANIVMRQVRSFADEKLLPIMRQTAPEAAITLENLYDYPSFAIDPGHELVTRTKSWAGRNDEAKVAYGTEAGYFSNELGIPTIVCGPGSIEQAHKPDEFIAGEQLAICEDFLRKVVDFASS